MSDTPDAQLAVDALEAAVAARQRHYMDQVVFHSDRNTQYTSQPFQAACARLGVAQSMSPTGSCGPRPVKWCMRPLAHPGV